jgi:ribonuclease Z
MLDNAPIRSITHAGLTIEGYSRAAVQSYWRIPELRIGFDMGASPWDFMSTPTWLLSHTHLDHIAALPVYVARRRMMKMEPPTIYMPRYAVDLFQTLLRTFSRLDRGRMPCEVIGVEPGEEFELSREHVLTVVGTKHTIPSVGYVLWDRRRKLKAEFQSLRGDQIRDLRLSGTDVTEEIRFPLVGYVGDSAPEGLDNNPVFFKAKILISEMTFVSPKHRKDKIHKYGHMHLDDYVDRKERFENECLIVSHFSTRYFDPQVAHYVKKAFPDNLGGRLHMWL